MYTRAATVPQGRSVRTARRPATAHSWTPPCCTRTRWTVSHGYYALDVPSVFLSAFYECIPVTCVSYIMRYTHAAAQIVPHRKWHRYEDIFRGLCTLTLHCVALLAPAVALAGLQWAHLLFARERTSQGAINGNIAPRTNTCATTFLHDV